MDDWKSRELKEIAVLHGGNGFPEREQGSKSGPLPFYKVSDMNSHGNEKYLTSANNYVDFDAVERHRWRILPTGTVVFAKVGAALLHNRRRILTVPSLVDNNMMGAIPGSMVSSLWLYMWLQTIDFANLVQVGALPFVNQEQLGQLTLNLPGPAEQKRIAEILDSLDQTIQATEQLITKHRKIRQGLAHDLLKGPPSGNRAMDDWKWEPLGCLAVIKMGQSPPGSAVSELRDGQPFLQGNAEFGTQSPHPRYQCNQAPKQARTGDLLISVRAPVGAINIADQRYGIGRGLAAIRFKNIHSQFGNHVIKTKARLLDRVAQGTTFTAIGRPDLASLPVPVPPLKKQKLIAEILDSADLAIQENEAELAKLQKLRSGLASDLLSGRVRTVAA
ncbi:MAG: restriction endonuclease subunit S [bacterium]|nr:restriction endonuclease subunit S [bacterium]